MVCCLTCWLLLFVASFHSCVVLPVDCARVSNSGSSEAKVKKRRKVTPPTEKVNPKQCMQDGNYDRNKTQILFNKELANQPVPVNNQDPRLKGKCRSFHVSRSKDSSVFLDYVQEGMFSDVSFNISPIITVEDVIAKRANEPSPRNRGCTMLHPYGSFIYPSHPDGGDGILYVEMPKVASTTLKYWMRDLFCIHPKFGADSIHSKYGKEVPIFSPKQLSFVIVREPLKRFLSGYQTVRIRALLKDSKLSRSKEDEVKRFKDYVDLVVNRGALLNEKNKAFSCAWCHTLSQMWFIDMYPHPISYVLHLENLEEELKVLGQRLPIVLPNTPLVAENTMESRVNPGVLSPQVLMESSPSSIKLIIDYSKQDYLCLGYPVPNL